MKKGSDSEDNEVEDRVLDKGKSGYVNYGATCDAPVGADGEESTKDTINLINRESISKDDAQNQDCDAAEAANKSESGGCVPMSDNPNPSDDSKDVESDVKHGDSDKEILLQDDPEQNQPLWRFALETAIPVLFAGFGMTAAGYVLGIVQVIICADATGSHCSVP